MNDHKINLLRKDCDHVFQCSLYQKIGSFVVCSKCNAIAKVLKTWPEFIYQVLDFKEIGIVFREMMDKDE